MSSSFERMVYTRSLLPMSSSHDQNLTANLHDQVLLPDHDGWYRSMNANVRASIESIQPVSDSFSAAANRFLERSQTGL